MYPGCMCDVTSVRVCVWCFKEGQEEANVRELGVATPERGEDVGVAPPGLGRGRDAAVRGARGLGVDRPERRDAHRAQRAVPRRRPLDERAHVRERLGRVPRGRALPALEDRRLGAVCARGRHHHVLAACLDADNAPLLAVAHSRADTIRFFRLLWFVCQSLFFFRLNPAHLLCFSTKHVIW